MPRSCRQKVTVAIHDQINVEKRGLNAACNENRNRELETTPLAHAKVIVTLRFPAGFARHDRGSQGPLGSAPSASLIEYSKIPRKGRVGPIGFAGFALGERRVTKAGREFVVQLARLVARCTIGGGVLFIRPALQIVPVRFHETDTTHQLLQPH